MVKYLILIIARIRMDARGRQRHGKRIGRVVLRRLFFHTEHNRDHFLNLSFFGAPVAGKRLLDLERRNSSTARPAWRSVRRITPRACPTLIAVVTFL